MTQFVLERLAQYVPSRYNVRYKEDSLLRGCVGCIKHHHDDKEGFYIFQGRLNMGLTDEEMIEIAEQITKLNKQLQEE